MVAHPKKHKLPAKTKGDLAPLFDRIIDDPMGIATPKLFLTPADLKLSIVNNIALVLNTRCTVKKVYYEDSMEALALFGFPDFFGLGDFSYFNASDTAEWPEIARFIELAIQVAEPRVEEIHVVVEAYDSSTQTLVTAVSATVKHSEEVKNIHFPLTLAHQETSGS